MPDLHPFQSPLAVPITGYIAEKRATGHKFEKGARLLKGFDSFVCSRNLQEATLTKALVMEWTARKPNETASTQGGRISLMRGLAVYMNRIGYAAYVVPKALITIDRYAYIPYIFSSDEMKAIFEVCDRYPSHDVTPNRHPMLPLLLRILYGCGLRISEALHLTIPDVDLDKGTLFIRHTKFNKERNGAGNMVKRPESEEWETRISSRHHMAEAIPSRPYTSSLEMFFAKRASPI